MQCNRNCCANCIDPNYVSPRRGSSGIDGIRGADTCADCVLAEETNHSISVQEELDVTEEINRGLKNELKQRIAAMEKFKTFMVEFCEAFGPGSPIFADDPDIDLNTTENIDSTMPIANLVEQCQENLHNIRVKVMMMRTERNNAMRNERAQRQIVTDMQSELDNVKHDRNELKKSVISLNQALLKMEAELEQVSDLKRECENLRERCKRLEQQRAQPSDRLGGVSMWNQRNTVEPQPRGSYVISLLCPRMGL